MSCRDSFVGLISSDFEKRLKEFIINTCNENNNSSGETVPVGAVIGFMKLQAPEGYLAMDGSLYNIEDYQNLASYFQNDLGSINYFGGDGITTFGVPDARGEFIRGYDINKKRDSEGDRRGIGKHQDATQHTNFNVSGEGHINGPEPDTYYKNTDQIIYGDNIIRFANSINYVSANKYNKLYTSRPTNINVLYCIKY